MKNLILIILFFILVGCEGRIEAGKEKQNNKTDEIPRCVIVSKSNYFNVYRCPLRFGAYIYCARTNAGVSSSVSCSR